MEKADLAEAFDWPRILRQNIEVDNVCFLDADILVNPLAPDVFGYHDDDCISVVSQTKTPFDYSKVLRKLHTAVYTQLSPDYPLDSSLFMSKKDYFQHHQFAEQEDQFCMVFRFQRKCFSEVMEQWFSNIRVLSKR